ncbi:GumC family protein [Thermomonas aquatica]|uniref:non-specific protein-tyrosine kinase n=1 Tax=Thermomonas aquatica TaxID=2202149 RepID=A0A5B7ZMK4_9GAMM|nr:polysaccharide biosynthesis tyrosine autokinase [Thermomonas aquatica]QDA55849.1 polysaccharide biosynthesis tyrosine autokinase [Thermomonas aquatica]
MTQDQFPVDAPGDGGNLPARHDPRARQQLSQMRSAATSLALDIQEELRDDEIDLLAYWHILVKRRWMVLSILAGVVALALLITLLTTPVYRASVLLELQKEGTQVVQVGGVQPGDFGGGWDPEFLQTQYRLIQSQSLAERVANELDLDRTTLGDLNQSGWFSRMLALLQPQSKQQAKKRGAADARQDAQQELMAAAGIVRRGLNVEPVRDSRLVRINYDSTIPGFSVRVANAVAEGFIAAGLERRFGATSYAKTYLEDQLRLTKAKLEDSERKLVVFAQKENLVNTGENGQSLATQNLTDLNAQLATAQGQRIRAEARWRQASGGGAMPSDMMAVSSVPSLRQQRGTLLAQYQEKLGRFKPDYPDMVALKGQIDEIDRQIGAELGSVRASVKAEYDAAAKQEGMLKGQIAALRGQALDVDGRSIQYNILKREADTNRQLYDSLLQRYKEVGVAGDVRANNVSIIDRAQIAWRVKPNLFTNLALGVLLGGLLGVLVALLLEFLDDTLKTPVDVEQKLKLAVLGVIPKLGAKDSMAAAAGNPQSSFSEAYRSVRTALQFSTDRGVPKTLLITSSGPGEGKSTTALALARNFAQLGKRVLLIEADLRNPSLHRTLGLRGHGVGLSNLLAGACTLNEATLDTDEQGLKVILAGPLPPNPAELLSGTKLVSALTVVAERYDQVILDGPPVLGLADAPILANSVDGTLLMVNSAKTKINAARAALKRLLAARARIVGALLAKYDVRSAGYSYGYGYHYHYESYYAYGGDRKLTKS